MNGGAQSRGPAPPLQKRADNSPEDKCREMEKEVNGLIEESAKLAQAKQFQPALDRAKEAGKLERQLQEAGGARPCRSDQHRSHLLCLLQPRQPVPPLRHVP